MPSKRKTPVQPRVRKEPNLERQLERANAEQRNEEIYRISLGGASSREIANVYGITPKRVDQIIKQIKSKKQQR